MSILTRLIAVYLALVAAAVAVNFIITPLYHPGGDAPFPVWAVLNWFMAAGDHHHRDRHVHGEAAQNPRSGAWGWGLRPEALPGGQHRLLWRGRRIHLVLLELVSASWTPTILPMANFGVVIDTLMPIVMGVAACRLWRNASA